MGKARGYTLVIPADEALRKELLWQHHDHPHAGHLGLYHMVRALFVMLLLARLVCKLQVILLVMFGVLGS